MPDELPDDTRDVGDEVSVRAVVDEVERAAQDFLDQLLGNAASWSAWFQSKCFDVVSASRLPSPST